MFGKKIKIVTHDSRFHADDIFSVAVLDIVFKGKIKVTRTRDEKLINEADIVLDIGGVYDAEKNRFDHHQKEGAGIRENGIPYASFGLIWKHFGSRICNEKVCKHIEEKIVQPIDAGDNGLTTFSVNQDFGVFPYIVPNMLYSLMPSWKEKFTFDEGFFEAVEMVKKILQREIVRAEHSFESEEIILRDYEKSEDKRIVVLDKRYSFSDEDISRALFSKPEVLYFLKYREEHDQWSVKAMRIKPDDFPSRKPFPKEWAGLSDLELQKVSGVGDAVFCHRGIFLAIAKSLEGAISLARKSLEN
ncbi:MAG: MYG1 family protein [Candidatus Paceibacterota bacterium]